jgi:hypothetical protein
MADEITFTIEGDDGSSDSVTLPRSILDLLAEEGDAPAVVVGDLALFTAAQRIHAAVHHAQGAVDDQLSAAETETMARFEERFGASYAEMTGHAH